ncbi:TadE family protein [Zafaria cholistanensis]|uniref:TadE family protein n=1 Tax=Zafaria cholistanensis TaxID=1682741 RepID=UPI0021F1E146|nr:TadE family protein [Zafaria cholistanensis]
MAEFIMVSALLTAVFLSVFQLALVLHVRNTLLDAAATGARHGTLADRSPADGAERARQLVTSALGPSFRCEVGHEATTIGGREGLRITVRTGFPLVGYLPVAGELGVQAEAVRYG